MNSAPATSSTSDSASWHVAIAQFLDVPPAGQPTDRVDPAVHAAFLEKAAPFGKRFRQGIKRTCDKFAIAQIAQRGSCAAGE
jgi:hypothetical protein